jgi:hypothetical protein
MSMKYELQYRDGNNYKFIVTAEINRQLEEGDTVTMEELGYTQEEFFDEFIHYPIDSKVDHNILDVLGRMSDSEDVQIIAK